MSEQYPKQTRASAAPQPSQEINRRVRSVFDYVEMFAIAVAVVILLLSFVFRLTVVVGGSMEQTLQDGQVLVITNLFYKPKTGDIIVIQPMTSEYSNLIIKRVIATEGQVVDIDFDTWTVTVDGVALDEPYVNRPSDPSIPMDGSYLSFPYTVEEGRVFVMGDNRNHSTDSRDIRFGPLDERYLLGKVLFCVYPFSLFGSVEH